MTTERLPEAVRAQAAEWFVRLQPPQTAPAAAQDLQAWQQWHAASPLHARAWAELQALWGALQPPEPAPAGLAEASLAGAESRGQARRRLLRRGAGGLLALGGLSLLGPGLLQAWDASQAPWRTALGQQGQWPLAGGHALWLNTDSSARPGEDAQTLALLRGELLLQTAAGSPLQLRSDSAVIQPASDRPCRFAWREEQDAGGRGGLLSVYQGRVALRARHAGESRWVGAGRQLRLHAGRWQDEGPARLLHEAWSRGLLVAEEMRLDDLLAELSRYRRGHLDCAPGVAGLRLVGSYPLADPERLLHWLASTHGLRLRQRLPLWTRLEAAD